MHESFRIFSRNAAQAAGSPLAFSAAICLVLLWCVSGPFFNFSDTWQLVINTGTTIVTFIMVFVIQNAQNRDSLALQLKLDELICAVEGARLGMIDLDKLSEDDLAKLQGQFQELARSRASSSTQIHPLGPVNLSG